MGKRLQSKWKNIVALCLAFMLLMCACGNEVVEDITSENTMAESEDTSSNIDVSGTEDAASSGARNGLNRATPKGNDIACTILVYMIGADLESEGGLASNDLEEMMEASFGDDIALIVQTGGATKWFNDAVDGDSVQRFQIKDGDITLIEDVGMQNMCDQDVLSDYLSWGVKNYPADRYAAILWDHGGGTMYGFGVDENYPNEESLTIADIKSAFDETGCYFDFVGFDACLMATIEVGYALKDSANYLIASEESESGLGWYYTDWLTALGEDPYMPTETIGRNVIDGFLEANGSNDEDRGAYGTADRTVSTLSLIDLGQIEEALVGVQEYFNISMSYLDPGQFALYAKARTTARDFGNGDFEQVDILDYMNQAAVPDTFDAQNKIRECIIYNNSNISGSNGLAMYYPYYSPSAYSTMVRMLEKIGIEKSYFEYFDTFCSVITYANNGDNDYVGEDWYSEDAGSEYYDNQSVSADDELIYEEYNGEYVIKLSDDDWDIISNIAIYVISDIGENDGFILLGSDNTFKLTDEGYLIGDFDGYWMYINDYLVPQYFMEDGNYDDGSYYSFSYVPAEKDGENIQIILYYYRPEGGIGSIEVMGYMLEDDSDKKLADRYYYEFEEGDEFRFYGDYFDDNLDYDAQYYLHEPVVVGEEGLTAEYRQIDSDSTSYFYYSITDIYQNEYTTEWIVK